MVFPAWLERCKIARYDRVNFIPLRWRAEQMGWKAVLLRETS